MLTGPVYSGGPGGPGGPSHPCGHSRGHGGQGQVRGCNWSLSSLKCPGWIAFHLEGSTCFFFYFTNVMFNRPGVAGVVL